MKKVLDQSHKVGGLLLGFVIADGLAGEKFGKLQFTLLVVGIACLMPLVTEPLKSSYGESKKVNRSGPMPP